MGQMAIGSRKIGGGESVFVIAEAGSNHDGKFEQAQRLIDVAAEAGADAVKFQLFRADTLYPEEVGMVDTPSGKIDFYAFLKSAEVPSEWLVRLSEYAAQRELVFLLSVFDEQAADELEQADAPAYKIASPELNHLPLLEHVAQKRRPIILSTGMSKLGEVEESLDAIYGQGNRDVALLHCISSYPTPQEYCNLRVIQTLRAAFDVPVGFSDHTVEATVAPALAVALGACIIEKHFTLDRTLPGPDHPFALEPPELKRMITRVHEVDGLSDVERERLITDTPNSFQILGNPVKQVTSVEADYYHCDRRSLHAVRDICEGEVLTGANTRILRSEKNLRPGLLPKYWGIVRGRRVSKFVPKGHGIDWDDLLLSRKSRSTT